MEGLDLPVRQDARVLPDPLTRCGLRSAYLLVKQKCRILRHSRATWNSGLEPKA
jgi:hypothetical protein